MKRIYSLLLMPLFVFWVDAQYTDFQSPLDIPLILSGNFAELRTDHFHSGLDFKTNGVTGLKVRSIESAYVSRIKIQTNGYGNSLYLNHPGGYTSVYGHLSAYNDIISEYVKKYQYSNETHTLDIYPGKNEIFIKKGDVIAYTGNTGSSSGPHLHFEIRNTASQHTLNGLNFNFKIEDNIKPKMYNVYVYSVTESMSRQRIIGRKRYSLIENNGSYVIQNDKVVEINSNTGFGLEVFDFLNGASNSCGIYTMELFVDGQTLYSFKTDEFSFAESKYINAHSDYALKTMENKQAHRLFKLPNYRLSMLKYQKESGILKYEPFKEYLVEIKVSDVAGNKTSLNFKVKATPSSPIIDQTENANPICYWDKPNEITNHIFKISIPSGALYEDAEINYSRVEGNSRYGNWIHKVADPSIPLHSGASLSLNISHIDSSLMSKACIVGLGKDNKLEYIGGKVNEEMWITSMISKFGSFSVDIDSISPEIKVQKSEKSLKFIISDNLSGIDQYNGFIDNQWALFEYDPKNNLLQYVFDPNRIKRNSNHELELYISDKKENTSLYHNSFYW